MFDMTKTIKPKTDQVNFDDFLGGKSLTINITDVKGSDAKDQPVSIHFEGDGGKPYKPCLSMRRVLVTVWGGDGKEYVGKSMTLYGDPNVVFGGIKVGGIRISNMSHLKEEKTILLTASKANKKPFTVKPLVAGTPPKEAHPDVIKQGNEAAQGGESAYKEWFEKLSPETRRMIKDHHEAWKLTAKEADKEKIAVTVKTDDDGYPSDNGQGDPEPE